MDRTLRGLNAAGGHWPVLPMPRGLCLTPAVLAGFAADDNSQIAQRICSAVELLYRDLNSDPPAALDAPLAVGMIGEGLVRYESSPIPSVADPCLPAVPVPTRS